MKKKDWIDIIKVVSVLCLLALVSGILLGTVHSFAEVTDEELLERLKAKMALVYEDADQLVIYENASYSSEVGELLNVYYKDESFVVYCSGKGGYGGNVELLVLIENNVIKNVACYKNAETPGVGSKALNESHFVKYMNTDISAIDGGFANSKQGGEVDFITGATKSSTAVNNAINVAVGWYLSREG